MSDTKKEEYTFKLTETGHIDIDHYMNKAHLSRAQAVMKVLCYARDKFIVVVRCAVRLISLKPCGKMRKDSADQVDTDTVRL